MATVGQRRRRRMRRQRMRVLRSEVRLVSPQRGLAAVQSQPTASRRGRNRRGRRMAVPRQTLSDAGKEFIECLLGAMTGNYPSSGIPDKYSGKSIVIEHRISTILTAGNVTNGFTCFSVPSPVCGLYFNSQAANNAPTIGATAYNYNTGGTGSWQAVTFGLGQGTSVAGTYFVSTDLGTGPFGLPYQEWYNGIPFVTASGGVGATQNTSITSTMWRPVSSQLRLTFTGSSLSDSGAIAVCRFPMSMTGQDEPFTATAAYRADNLWESRVGYGYGTTSSSDFSATASADGAVVGALRDGVYTVNVPMDAEHSFMSFKNNGIPSANMIAGGISFYQISFDDNNGASHAAAASPIPGFGGMTSTAVSVSGMSSTQTCLIEQTNCIEYQVSPTGSVFSRLARESPRSDEAAIEVASNMAKCLPPAVPARESLDGSWWDRVAMFVSGVGRVASGVGNLAAGLGKLAVGVAPYAGAALAYSNPALAATLGLGAGATRLAIGY